VALRKKIYFLLPSLSLLLAYPWPLFSHPGPLDSQGGHHDRKSGQYHCHRSPCLSLENGNGHSENGARKRKGVRRVLRVIDGDTVELYPNERVRLIGVDTPETAHPKRSGECFGPEASEFTRRMIEGKRIRLELDEANAARQHKDPYRRTLAYVYLEDGSFLNAEIIRLGYGKVYTKARFRYRDEFMARQHEAQERGLGLWLACNGRGHASSRFSISHP